MPTPRKSKFTEIFTPQGSQEELKLTDPQTDKNPDLGQTLSLSQTGSVGHHVPAPREKTRPDSPRPYTGELETRPERRHSQRGRHALPPLKKKRPDSPRPYMERAETSPESNIRNPPMRGALNNDPRRWGLIFREDGTEFEKKTRKGNTEITTAPKLGTRPEISPPSSPTGPCGLQDDSTVSVPMQTSGGSTRGRNGMRETSGILPPPFLRSATSPPSLPLRRLRRVPRNSNLNGRSPRDL
ncbi:uncharacterized protein L3040_002553 [Drepanopeziza brunnea f. sp. 'multigermtubi']|nr:hypothetical protein L3040_002553 [Drepanopeziza brunnea f. sp. 'multigermtubi']